MSVYTLFIDESGEFNLQNLTESSQIVALLLPGTPTEERALPDAIKALFPLGQQSHATEMPVAEREALLTRVLNVCASQGWRLGRMIHNHPRPEHPEASETYTRLLARFIVELYKTLLDEGEEVVFHLVCARVSLGVEIDGVQHYYPNVSLELREHPRANAILIQEAS
ncbi:MAG: hypothetical protein FJ138_13855, partial [Deltaproteobacteria bacterium]|nr:hypothetical protein [Deltaproteobacteria bacterium]